VTSFSDSSDFHEIPNFLYSLLILKSFRHQDGFKNMSMMVWGYVHKTPILCSSFNKYFSDKLCFCF